MSIARFYKSLHPFTVLALLVISTSLGTIQLQPRQGYFTGGAVQFTNQQFYGWPRTMLDRTTTQSLVSTLNPLSTATTSLTEDELDPSSLTVNVVVCLAFILSAAFCIERWLRRQTLWQFGIRDVAIVVLVGSLVFACYEPAFEVWALPSPWLVPHVGFDVGSMPFYFAIPFFVGTGFVIYSIGATIQSLGAIVVFVRSRNIRWITKR